jgi:hypothetical protein
MHGFGNDCLRNHVAASIDRKIFPITCPDCMAGASPSRGSGSSRLSAGTSENTATSQPIVFVSSECASADHVLVLSTDLLNTIGIDKQRRVRLDELSMTNYAIEIACGK